MMEKLVATYWTPVWDTVATILILFIPAGLARLLWHWNMVQEGRRRFWSVHLLFELPVAALSMYLGAGIAEWIGAGPKGTMAIVGFAAWLGPKGLEALLLLVIKTARAKPTN